MILPFLAANCSSTEAFLVVPPSRPASQTRVVPQSSSRHHLVVDATLELANSPSVSSLIMDSGMLLGGAFIQPEANQAHHHDGVLTCFSTLTTAMEAMQQQFCTPDIEAEVLTDIDHVIIDFFAFFRPSKFLMKSCSVVGRLLLLFADYIPDHSVHPEELIVQLALLGVGVKGLLEDASFAPGFADGGSVLVQQQEQQEANSSEFEIGNMFYAFKDRMNVDSES
jgi:hypothetical protein